MRRGFLFNRRMPILIPFIFVSQAFAIGKVVCSTGETTCAVKNQKVEILLEATGGRVQQKWAGKCTDEKQKKILKVDLRLLDGDTNEMVGLGKFNLDLSKAPCKPDGLRVSYLKHESVVWLKY